MKVFAIALVCVFVCSLGHTQTEPATPTPAPTLAPAIAPPPVPSPLSADEVFVDKLWGKEFGQCFMSATQYEDFEKKWTRYRILTRARYNILAKSYFGDKTPKLPPIEIDKAFQYQALEPMTCPGMTDEDRFKAVEKALELSLGEEGYKVTDTKTLFELDEPPRKLEDFLDLFNDPSLISMPYTLQDGYDQLFKLEWERTNSKKEVEYEYADTSSENSGDNETPKSEMKKLKFSKNDLRAIDAIARTIHSEAAACESPDKGHYQMMLRILWDRLATCDRDPLVNRRHCRADPFGQALPRLEQVIAAPAQYPSWNACGYGMVEVSNAAGKKIGRSYKEGTGFRKLVKPNEDLRRTLCPAPDAALKKAYLATLEFYRDAKAYSEKWQWPKNVRGGIRFYSYGLSFEKGSPKNVHSIFDHSMTPPREVDFKKMATASCPLPYLYERR